VIQISRGHLTNLIELPTSWSNQTHTAKRTMTYLHPVSFLLSTSCQAISNFSRINKQYCISVMHGIRLSRCILQPVSHCCLPGTNSVQGEGDGGLVHRDGRRGLVSRGIRGEVVCGAEVVKSGRARFRRAKMALLPEARRLR
jgi:hypothetical protein